MGWIQYVPWCCTRVLGANALGWRTLSACESFADIQQRACTGAGAGAGAGRGRQMQAGKQPFHVAGGSVGRYQVRAAGEGRGGGGVVVWCGAPKAAKFWTCPQTGRSVWRIRRIGFGKPALSPSHASPRPAQSRAAPGPRELFRRQASDIAPSHQARPRDCRLAGGVEWLFFSFVFVRCVWLVHRVVGPWGRGASTVCVCMCVCWCAAGPPSTSLQRRYKDAVVLLMNQDAPTCKADLMCNACRRAGPPWFVIHCRLLLRYRTASPRVSLIGVLRCPR